MTGKTIRYGIAIFALAGSLSGCLQTEKAGNEDPIYTPLNQPYVAVDAEKALSMINAYRKNNGLKALTLDKRLTAAATEQVTAMADTGKIKHTLGRDMTLPKRLVRAGYDFTHAAENISAGYWTLAEAFSGWRDSKEHNKNMLNRDVTQMGIATYYKPNVKYKVFWSLILAKPKRQPAKIKVLRAASGKPVLAPAQTTDQATQTSTSNTQRGYFTISPSVPQLFTRKKKD